MLRSRYRAHDMSSSTACESRPTGEMPGDDPSVTLLSAPSLALVTSEQRAPFSRLQSPAAERASVPRLVPVATTRSAPMRRMMIVLSVAAGLGLTLGVGRTVVGSDPPPPKNGAPQRFVPTQDDLRRGYERGGQ